MRLSAFLHDNAKWGIAGAVSQCSANSAVQCTTPYMKLQLLGSMSRLMLTIHSCCLSQRCRMTEGWAGRTSLYTLEPYFTLASLQHSHVRGKPPPGVSCHLREGNFSSFERPCGSQKFPRLARNPPSLFQVLLQCAMPVRQFAPRLCPVLRAHGAWQLIPAAGSCSRRCRRRLLLHDLQEHIRRLARHKTALPGR